jgi:hypothetical protein
MKDDRRDDDRENGTNGDDRKSTQSLISGCCEMLTAGSAY